jgi:hypothetical protein
MEEIRDTIHVTETKQPLGVKDELDINVALPVFERWGS